MGKKGRELRANKAKNTLRTVSDAWLAEHDKQVIDLYEKRRRDYVEEAVLECIPYFIAISVLVLVRDFGWGRIRSEKDSNRRLARFCDEVSREFDRVFNHPDEFDLNEYLEQVWEYTGVRLESQKP